MMPSASSGASANLVGQAVVSPRHANFVVNEGGATAADVLGLVDEVRERGRAATGVELELEVKVWGPRS